MSSGVLGIVVSGADYPSADFDFYARLALGGHGLPSEVRCVGDPTAVEDFLTIEWLKQRGEVLKAASAQPSLAATLDMWDEQLAAAGAELMRQRRSYIARLNAEAAQVHREISDGREQLEIRYAPSVTLGDDEQAILDALLVARETDLRRMTTSMGAHRDDVMLMIGGRDVRAYGSQGQQRTAALAMRLAELSVMRQELGEWPMLMLDDVMSELDPSRRRQLIKRLNGIQTFITCTDPDDLAGAEVGRMWRVSQGALQEV